MNRLLDAGVDEKNITLIGFSPGSHFGQIEPLALVLLQPRFCLASEQTKAKIKQQSKKLFKMSNTFDFKPVLEGPRVIVRPIQEDDWEGMFAAAANPKVWELHPVTDRYKEPVFRAFFDDAIASGSAFTFVDGEAGRIIGSSRFNGLDEELGEIEIGWTFLDYDYWGGSYNAEIKKLMLEHAFKFVDTVVFWVGDTNIVSMRAMEKIGGVKRDEVIGRVLNGINYPHIIYEIRNA